MWEIISHFYFKSFFLPPSPCLFLFKNGTSVYAPLNFTWFSMVSSACFYAPPVASPNAVPTWEGDPFILAAAFDICYSWYLWAPSIFLSLSSPALENYSKSVLSTAGLIQVRSSPSGRILSLVISEVYCCYIPLCSPVLSHFCLLLSCFLKHFHFNLDLVGFLCFPVSWKLSLRL